MKTFTPTNDQTMVRMGSDGESIFVALFLVRADRGRWVLFDRAQDLEESREALAGSITPRNFDRALLWLRHCKTGPWGCLECGEARDYHMHQQTAEQCTKNLGRPCGNQTDHHTFQEVSK